MTKYKFVYQDFTHTNAEGHPWSFVHFLVTHSHNSLEGYKAMADEVLQTFPHFTDAELHCSTVSRSIRYGGFTILYRNGYLENREYPGWEVKPISALEYSVNQR